MVRTMIHAPQHRTGGDERAEHVATLDGGARRDTLSKYCGGREGEGVREVEMKRVEENRHGREERLYMSDTDTRGSNLDARFGAFLKVMAASGEFITGTSSRQEH